MGPPPEIREASAGIQTVALVRLMRQLGAGEIVGLNSLHTDSVSMALPQRGFPPGFPGCFAAPSAFIGSVGRQGTLADQTPLIRLSPNDALWGGSFGPRCEWWFFFHPSPFGGEGGLPGFSDSAANAAFRFAVVHMDRTRACDDFKYGRANTCCATRARIMLPT